MVNFPTFWYVISFVSIVGNERVRHTNRKRRSESHDFPIDGFKIRQRFAVCQCRKSFCAYHAIQLGLGFALDFRIEDHLVEKGAGRRNSLWCSFMISLAVKSSRSKRIDLQYPKQLEVKTGSSNIAITLTRYTHHRRQCMQHSWSWTLLPQSHRLHTFSRRSQWLAMRQLCHPPIEHAGINESLLKHGTWITYQAFLYKFRWNSHHFIG